MHTLQRKTAPLALAGAALAVVAVFALMLLAGGAPAQATTTSSLAHHDDDGGNPLPLPQEEGEEGQEPTNTPTPTPEPTDPTPTPTPVVHATAEPCPPNPTRVIDTGHHALFDVYWSEDDRNLVTNPCPPTISVETIPPQGSGSATYRHVRGAPDANVDTTIFHVPGAADLTPRANNDEDYGKWPFLYPDVKDGDDDNTTITGNEIGDPISTSVWTLPDCEPGITPPPSPRDLCIGFSAQLLRETDWERFNFEFESIREPGIKVADRGHVFVFYRPDDVPAGEEQLIWQSDDVTSTKIPVEAGDDLHPQWAFTKAGTYRFQVHANGDPSIGNSLAAPDQDPVSPGEIVTSQVRTYLLHVGDLSDLSVAIAAEPTPPSAGGEVTYTVKASNAGPNPAAQVTVTLALPDGLTYKSDSANPATGTTYDAATGVWSIGTLGKTDDDNEATDDDSPTLTLVATTGSNTHGKALTVTAKIKALETIGTSVVDELDPDESNNEATVTVTPPSDDNAAPTFRLARSIMENSAPGSAVGGPVGVYDPNSGDTLTFGLSGTGANQFAVAADPDGNAQISVAKYAALNYEDASSYNLILTVSDGKDSAGNADAAVDHRIGVLVNITDVANETLAISLSADPTTAAVSGTAVLHTRITSSPVASSKLRYRINEQTVGGGGRLVTTDLDPDQLPLTVTWGAAVTREYTMDVWNHDDFSQQATSNTVQITWTGE